MKISSEHYFKASQDRIKEASKLHNSGNYVGSIYLSGVSVECIFRAYTAKNMGVFDSRHDLTLLLKASGVSEIVSVSQRRNIGAALGDIWARWKNNYRYASEELIRAEPCRVHSMHQSTVAMQPYMIDGTNGSMYAFWCVKRTLRSDNALWLGKARAASR